MKRKILILGLAVCLFFQGTGIVALAAESQAIVESVVVASENPTENTRSTKLEKPSNLYWKADNSGTICWGEVTGAEGSYATVLKKNGNQVGTIEPYDNPESKGTYEYYYGPLIEANGAGTYTFEVKAVGQEGVSDSDWGNSSEFIYTEPSDSLAIPTNLRWDTKGDRIYACWDKVEGAAGYQVEFSYDSQYVEGKWAATYVEYKGSDSCKIDFTDNVYYGEDYYFKVSALSPDICSKRSSVFSTMSEKYDASTALKDASNAVENVVGKLDKLKDDDDIIYAVDDLVDNIGDKIGELAAAMRSDKNSLSNMQTLEEAYAKASNIQVENNVANDISINKDKISVIGAALNAGTSTNISLNFNKLSENSGIDKSDWQYKNTIEFEIDLTGTDSESITLKVPVHITMPVPEEIDIDKLEILHYTSKDKYERLELTRDHVNNTVSFVVTSFSPFVFGELEENETIPDAPVTPTPPSNPSTPETPTFPDNIPSVPSTPNDSDNSDDSADDDIEDDIDDNVSDDENKENMKEEIADNYSISYQNNATYTGSAIQPSVSVFDGKRQLAEGSDYTVSYKNNINAGTAQIIIKGKNGHSINETRTFTITAISLNDASISVSSIYSDKTVKNPVPTITRNGKKLSNGTDFRLDYENGGNYSSSGKITVIGRGNYTGSVTVSVTIVDGTTTKLISKAKVSNVKNLTYGQDYKQSPVVKFGKESLSEGKDYTISYENVKQAGTATMILTGKGDYVGEKRITFKIAGTSIKKATVTGLETPISYTGSVIKANYTLRLNGTTLVEGKDYTVSYGKNISAGKATITFTGIGGYTGSLKKKFTIGKAALEADNINFVNGDTYTYVKGGVKPEITVTFGGMTLREKADYTVSYKKNKKVGTATVIIKGKGSFSGKFEKTFTIQ